jgi:hypothetical protein
MLRLQAKQIITVLTADLIDGPRSTIMTTVGMAKAWADQHYNTTNTWRVGRDDRGVFYQAIGVDPGPGPGLGQAIQVRIQDSIMYTAVER